MFERSGEKIKKVSTTVFYINLAIAMIVVIIAIFNLSGYGGMPLLIVAAIIVILAWVSSLFLYAFGDLVESNQQILELLREGETKGLEHNINNHMCSNLIQLLEKYENGDISKKEFLNQKNKYWSTVDKIVKSEKELNKIKKATMNGLFTNYEYETIYNASKL